MIRWLTAGLAFAGAVALYLISLVALMVAFVLVHLTALFAEISRGTYKLCVRCVRAADERYNGGQEVSDGDDRRGDLGEA